MTLPAQETFTNANTGDMPAALANWSQTTGATLLGINTNAVYQAGASNSLAYWDADTPGADQLARMVSAAVDATGTAVGPAVRVGTSSVDGYYMGFLTGGGGVNKVVANSLSTIISGLAGGLAGDTYGIAAIGTLIRAYRNGIQIGSVTDSSLSSGRLGVAGGGPSTTNARGDDWQGDEVGSGLTAPTLVSSDAAVFTATNGAGVTPTATGEQADDIDLLVCHISANTDIATPSGYAYLPVGVPTTGADTPNNTTAQRVEVFWRRLQSGDVGSDPTVLTLSSTAVRGAQRFIVRGCPTVGIPLASWGRSNNAASATVTFPGADVAPAGDDTLALAVYAYEDDPSAGSTMTNWSATTVSTSSLGNDMAIGYATRTLTAAGAIGATSLTVSGGTFANSPNVGMIFTFLAASAGPVVVDLAGNPATLTLTTVDPTVVNNVTLDLSASPSLLTLATVDPTVIHGSLALDLTASPALLTLTTVDPAVAMSSIAIDLAASPALLTLTTVNPTVVNNVTLDLSGSPASLALATVDPTVIHGSLALDLSASPALVTLATVDPTVIHGSLALNLSASPALLTLTTVDPTVVAGGDTVVDLSGAPSLLTLTTVDPTVVQGSLALDLAASPALLTLTTVDPTIINNVTLDLSGAAASLALTTVDPTVIHGSLALDLAASPALLTLTTVDPTIVLGSLAIDLAASPALLTLTTVDPFVAMGGVAVDLSASPALLTLSTVNPTVIHGSLALDLSGAAATLTLATVDPTVILGSVTVNLAGSPAVLTLTTVDPTVINNLLIDLAASPALLTLATVNPTVVHGSIALDLSAVAAVLALGTVDPSVVLGSIVADLAASPALLALTTTGPEVLIVDPFDWPLHSVSVAAPRPGSTSAAARPGASSTAARPASISSL